MSRSCWTSSGIRTGFFPDEERHCRAPWLGSGAPHSSCKSRVFPEPLRPLTHRPSPSRQLKLRSEKIVLSPMWQPRRKALIFPMLIYTSFDGFEASLFPLPQYQPFAAGERSRVGGHPSGLGYEGKLMSEVPLLAFAVLRPGLCLLVALSAFGWGCVLDRDRSMSTAQRFCFGLFSLIFAFWIPGFFGAWSAPMAMSLLAPGVIVGFLHLRVMLSTVSWIAFGWSWLGWLLLCLCFVVAFIRASAPPYFIDQLQYQLPLARQLFFDQGFVGGTDFFFANLTSTAVHESLGALMMTVGGDGASLCLFNLVIFAMTLVELCPKDRCRDSACWFVLLLLPFCGAFFHSVVYGKTEVMLGLAVVCFFNRARYLLRGESIPRFSAYSCGLFFAFVVCTKLSAILPALGVLMLLLCLLTMKKLSWLTACLFTFGALLPVALVALKNNIVIGMPWFPFVLNPDAAPQVLEQGVRAWASSDLKVGLWKRLTVGVEQIVGLYSSRHFGVGLFFPLVLAVTVAAVVKRQRLFLLLMLCCLLNWFYWLCTYLFPASTLRIHLPFFLLVMAVVPEVLKKTPRVFNFVLVAVTVVGATTFLWREARILPGLRVHLGQQQPSHFQVLMGNRIAVLQPEIDAIPKSEGIAVCSEFAGALYGRPFVVVNLSTRLQKQPVLGLEHLLAWMKDEEVRHFILQGETHAAQIWSTVESGLDEGRFVLKKRSVDVLMVSLASKS